MDHPVRKLRLEQELTLREVSEMTGISIQTIHYIERRKQVGTVANYQKLAAALGVDLTKLIETSQGRYVMRRER